MATITGFTRPPDPINEEELCRHVGDIIGKECECEIYKDSITVSGDLITSEDTAAIQAAITSYDYEGALPQPIITGYSTESTLLSIKNVDGIKKIVDPLPSGTNPLGKILPPDVDITTHANYARKYYTSAGAATGGVVWSPAAGKRWHKYQILILVFHLGQQLMV